MIKQAVKKWYKRWIKREKWHSQLHVENKNKMIVEAIEQATIELRNKYNFSMQVIEDTEYPFPSATFQLFERPFQPAVFTGEIYFGIAGQEYGFSCTVNYKNEKFIGCTFPCEKENLDQLSIESAIRSCLLDIDYNINKQQVEKCHQQQ